MKRRGLVVKIPSSLYREVTRARRRFSYDRKHPASLKATISVLLQSVKV